jgi:multiple sugar transport system substrate-binding protein
MQMQHLSRRKFLQLSTTVAGAVALSACVAAPGAPAGGAAGEAAPAGERITLSFGHHWEAAFQPVQADFDAKYMEAHPNIEITVTNNTWGDHNQIVPTWAAAGTLPDVIYVHGRYAFPWNYEGIVVSLQDYIDNDPDFNVAGIWEEALRLYRFNGNQHELPYDHGPVILGYNKDIFDAAGHDYPSPDWSMDDFRQAAIALTDLSDANNPRWGYAGSLPDFGNTANGPMLYGWGVEPFNEDETAIQLDSDEARAAVQFWVDIIHADKAAPTPAESTAFEQGAWIAGRVAMNNVASWSTPTLHNFASFAWDVAPWPQGPVTRGTGSFGSGFGVTRDSQQVEEGWNYLREYLSKEGMETMWGVTGRGSPARKDAYESWMNSDPAPDNAQFFLEALDSYAKTDRPYQTLAGGEILDILNRQTTLLRNGETTVDDAINAIITEGTPVLEAAAQRLQGG